MRTIAPEVTDATIGARAKAARAWVGLNQEVAGQALGIGRSSLSSMEHGETKITALLLYKMAALYRVPYGYFFGADPFEAYGSGPRGHLLFEQLAQLSKSDRDQVALFVQFLAFSREQQ